MSMYPRERAVGSRMRKRYHRDESGGKMEERETTPTEVTQGARAPCGAAGGNEVPPRVMGVHLIYRV